MEFIIPIALVIIICVMLWGWAAVLRRIPLQDFGMDNVERILNLESEQVRDRILQRGWMTNNEWAKLLRKHPSALQESAKRTTTSK
jgi:hypothetical protein